MSVSVDQTLRKAKRHTKKSETDLAAQLYKSILEKYPGNKSAIAGLRALQHPTAVKKPTKVGPSQEQINGLIALYNQEKFQQALDDGETLEKQFPKLPFMPNLLGVVNAALGRFKQAIASYQRALAIKPDYAEAHNNLGVALRDLGKLEEAVTSCTKALKFKPDYAEAHNNLGTALYSLGKLEEAVISYTKALELKPDYVEAHNNLGTALYDLGKLEEAVTSYTKALELKPDYVEAHNNLGVALRDLGKLEEAVTSCTKALKFRPDYAEAHNNLGTALYDLGKLEEAVTSYMKAVSLAADRKDYWQNFSIPLREMSFIVYTDQWASIFLDLLDQKTVVKPSKLAKAILDLLKLHPSIQETLQLLGSGNIQKSALAVCNSLSDIPLFLRIIEKSSIIDLEVEKLLRVLRCSLLTIAAEVVGRREALNFQLSLALHCFTNEYVFGETDEEILAVQALEANIDRKFAAGKEPSPFAIACLASYRPLHRFGWSHQVVVPEYFKELFEQQVKQVQEEALIRTMVQTLKQIDDHVSKAVRTQYEENPYPRWTNTRLSAEPLAIRAVANKLKLKISDGAEDFSARPEILIAGCGTGQHALQTATRFLNSRVLAIDLSLSSLSYAIRKTQELGIINIEYLQADILDLDSMGNQFDLIESVGVLHHMSNPMVGWRILTKRLKPGGMMKIGLYSKFARKSVVAAREVISAMGLSGTTRDILKFRTAVLDPDGRLFSKLFKITKYGDFFSTSELRDLLFHVKEHRFTLPQIKEILELLGLTFAGFEFPDEKIVRQFIQMYPDPQSIYCLDAWNDFELANADVFIGMYQFWAQKNVDV